MQYAVAKQSTDKLQDFCGSSDAYNQRPATTLGGGNSAFHGEAQGTHIPYTHTANSRI